MHLKQVLAHGTVPAVATLCLDPLTARLSRQAGFELGYLSGGALGYSYAVSEALLTLTEIADCARRIVTRSDVELLVDVGVGFGDPVHVARMVWEIEATGAAAIEIEDQVAPKRVSHHRGIEHLVPQDVMVQKIEQAAAARTSDEFLIIARTGAVKNESLELAIARLRAYQQAGADVLMLMPENAEQAQAARAQLQGPLATITAMDRAAHEQWTGWQLIIDPFTTQVLALQNIQRALQRFQETGSTGTDLKELFTTYNQLDAMAGLDALYAIEDATTERQ